MLQNIEKIVVISGCQRSGTTMVGQIVGAHPNAILIDEVDSLYEWFNAVEGKELEDGPILQAVFNKAICKYITEHKRLREISGRGGVISPEITHLVLKAPNLAYSYEKLAQLIVPISILYPVRDPRSVVASMKKLRHINMIGNQLRLIAREEKLASELKSQIDTLNDKSVPLHIKWALVWRIKSGLFNRFSEHGLPTFVFKYEDLVADKRNSIRQLADHVELKFDEIMTQHEMVYRGLGPGYTERTRPVDSVSIGKWSNRLTRQDEVDVLDAAGKVASEFGYTLSVPGPHVAARSLIENSVLNSPVILTGRGGSGTRIISEIAQSASVFLGNRTNVSGDSTEWVDLIYELGIEKNTYNSSDKEYLQSVGRLLKDKAIDVLSYGKWNDGQMWGWKLPETMLVVPEVMSTFDNAKLVHLVRHPVDSSLRRTHMTSRETNPIGSAVLKAAYLSADMDPDLVRTHGGYMHNAITWLYQVELVTKYAHENLTSKNYLELRYEDLCSDLDHAVNKLIDFVGGSHSSSQLPAIERNRMRYHKMSDPRIDEVWGLCKDVAVTLGYKAVQ